MGERNVETEEMEYTWQEPRFFHNAITRKKERGAARREPTEFIEKYLGDHPRLSDMQTYLQMCVVLSS